MSDLLTPPTKEELQEEKEQRRDKRLDDCGSWASWYDPHTGKMTGFKFFCDLWRDCPTCLERRATREKQFLEETIQNKRIVVLQTDPSETPKITRKLTKDEYQRFPQDGYDLLFLDERTAPRELLGESVNVTARWIEQMDWETIVKSPGRKNKSGALFTSTKTTPKEEGDWSIITTTQFVSNAPRAIIHRVSEQVVAATSNMNPETVDEVIEFLQIRVFMTIEMLQERGYDCTIYEKKLKLSMSKVNWCNNLCLINGKNDINDTNKHDKH